MVRARPTGRHPQRSAAQVRPTVLLGFAMLLCVVLVVQVFLYVQQRGRVRTQENQQQSLQIQEINEQLDMRAERNRITLCAILNSYPKRDSTFDPFKKAYSCASVPTTPMNIPSSTKQ